MNQTWDLTVRVEAPTDMHADDVATTLKALLSNRAIATDRLTIVGVATASDIPAWLGVSADEDNPTTEPAS